MRTVSSAAAAAPDPVTDRTGRPVVTERAQTGGIGPTPGIRVTRRAPRGTHAVTVTGALTRTEVGLTGDQADALLTALIAALDEHQALTALADPPPFDLSGTDGTWVPVTCGTEIHHAGPDRGQVLPVQAVGLTAGHRAGIAVHARHGGGRFLGFLTPDQINAALLPLTLLTTEGPR